MPRPLALLRRTVLGAAVIALAVGGTVTGAQAANDAPGRHSNVTTTSPQDTWVTGVIGSPRDVDVYRFKTSKSRYARILLGDLGANYRMRLLNSAGRAVGTSDRTRRGNEELYRHLVAGTYYLAVDAPHGAVSTRPYVVKFTSLPEGVLVLSRGEWGSGEAKELVFEVLNNTSRSVGQIGYEVRSPCPPSDNPFDVCAPNVTWEGQNRVIPPRGRASFFTSLAGHTDYTFRFHGAQPINYVSKLSGRITRMQPVTGGYAVSGTVTNNSRHVTCSPYPTRTSYDARGNVLGSTEVRLLGWSVAPGRTVSWSVDRLSALPPRTVRTEWRITEKQVYVGDPVC